MSNPAIRLFLWAYIISCFIFWWLTNVLFWVFDLPNTVELRFVWYSAGAALLFAVGYLLPTRTPKPRTSLDMLDGCARLAWRATLALSVPALVLSILFALYRSGLEYGEGENIPLIYQAVLYGHLFFGLLYLGATDGANRKRLWLAVLLVAAPRLLISFHWSRFFAAQALLPIIFIAVARGWLQITKWRFVQIGVLGLFLIFVPALTRGDQVVGEDASTFVRFFQTGSTLVFLQTYSDLKTPCPPLLVSLTAKVVPYGLIGHCTIDVGNAKGLPATMTNLLTHEESDDLMRGTGGNYLSDHLKSGQRLSLQNRPTGLAVQD